MMSQSKNKEFLLGYLGRDPGISGRFRGDNTNLLHNIAIGMHEKGVTVFVMDIGGGFKDLCNQVQGELIRLDKINQKKSGRFTSCVDVMTVFDFEDLLDDMPFMTRTLHNLLLLITMQFVSGKRSGRFVFIISEDWMLEGLRPLNYENLVYFKELHHGLKKHGGSLISCFKQASDFEEKYAKYFHLIT